MTAMKNTMQLKLDLFICELLLNYLIDLDQKRFDLHWV